jgi:quinol monooxygenase YgiN
LLTGALGYPVTATAGDRLRPPPGHLDPENPHVSTRISDSRQQRPTLDRMIVVHAILRSKPERRAETAEALAEMQRATNELDEGCLHYAYLQSLTDPDEFTAVEEWRDEEALRAHIGSSHLARLDEVLERTAAGKAIIRVFEAAPRGLPA